MAEGREHDEGHLREALLDVAGNAEHIVVLSSGHTDDEVEAGALKFGFRFFGRGYLEKAGREAEPQFGIFVKDLFVHTSIILQHESVIGIGNDENVADAPHHEMGEGGIPQYRTGLHVFLWHGKARRARSLK